MLKRAYKLLIEFNFLCKIRLYNKWFYHPVEKVTRLRRREYRYQLIIDTRDGCTDSSSHLIWSWSVTNEVLIFLRLVIVWEWRSHSVFSCPLSGCVFILGSFVHIYLSNFRHKWVLGIRVSQQGTDRKKDLANCESRAPLILQNVQANCPIWVDVRVVDASWERKLWCLEGIVSWEVNVQEEHSSCIRRVLWSN